MGGWWALHEVNIALCTGRQAVCGSVPLCEGCGQGGVYTHSLARHPVRCCLPGPGSLPQVFAVLSANTAFFLLGFPRSQGCLKLGGRLSGVLSVLISLDAWHPSSPTCLQDSFPGGCRGLRSLTGGAMGFIFSCYVAFRDEFFLQVSVDSC